MTALAEAAGECLSAIIFCNKTIATIRRELSRSSLESARGLSRKRSVSLGHQLPSTAPRTSNPAKNTALFAFRINLVNWCLTRLQRNAIFTSNKIHGRGALIISTLFDMAGIYDYRGKDDLPKITKPCSFAIWLHG